MPENYKFNRIKYHFFSAKYGVSKYPYEALNCGLNTADIPRDVKQNRSLVKKKIGFENLFFLEQMHSNKVITLKSKKCLKSNYQGDGIVTKLTDVGLSILTADCAPIFFFDDVSKTVGACHAGWKGALNGILENTIHDMLQLGSLKQNIHVLIGPTIHKNSYQIRNDLESIIKKTDIFSLDKKILVKRGKVLIFDLPLFIKNKLLLNGINKINDVNIDTYINKNYFSHRRCMHNKIGLTGRQVSIIGLIK